MKEKQDLTQIIKDNPGCKAIIDNDCWWLYTSDSDPYDEEAILLADYNTVEYKGSCSGNGYGGDILQALAEIVGIKIESV